MRRLLVIFGFLLLLAALATTAGILLSDGSVDLAGPRLLTWEVGPPILDYAPPPRIPLLPYASGDSLASLYASLAGARRDDSVRGVAVEIRAARMGLATAQELHRLLAALGDAGKSVDCYLETAGEGSNGTLAYYLSTACDRISLAPAGELNLLGLYSDGLFLRGTLDKLRIDPQVTAVGPYKSAAETYTRRERSAAAEEALGAVLDDLFAQLVATVAERRGLDEDQVRRLIDRAPFSAQEALDLGLIDRIAFPDEFRDALDERSPGVARQPLVDYRGLPRTARGDRLAVVFAQGTILRGDGGVDPWTEEILLGSDTMREVLADLAERDSVVGIVLRIDSPGGSALASDLILRAVELAARDKPLVVSMSDVAASGGYYIAAKADRIVADPATITGSIGVYGGKLVTERFQRELLGITHDGMKRGANADIYSAVVPFDEAQAERFRRLMERTYENFVGHVSAGRSLSRDQVERVAGGRIWTGSQALEHGLVDELGGLEEALRLAWREAGKREDEPMRLDYFPRPPGLLAFLEQRGRGLLSARRPRLGLPDPGLGLLRLPPELAQLTHPF